MKLIVATNNIHKLEEIKEILNISDLEITNLKSINFTEEIIENGNSFKENALIKTKSVFNFLRDNNFNDDFLILGDDSGLEVKALNNRPGIFSARYAGEGATQKMLIEKLLKELGDNPDRDARFVCVISLITSDGKELFAEGICEGKIGWNAVGTNGFGYDPIFLPKDYNYEKTMAELTSSEKNSISHRGRALNTIKKFITKAINGEL